MLNPPPCLPSNCFYNAETASEFNLSAYDYVVDAIDSLQDKALLLLNATRSSARVFSSMGAASVSPTASKLPSSGK